MTHCSATTKPIDRKNPEGYYYYFSPTHSPTPFYICSEAYRNFDNISTKSRHFKTLPTPAILHRYEWIFVGNPLTGSIEEKYMRLQDSKDRNKKQQETFSSAIITN
jgi:hypothetical protein